MVSENKTNTNV